MKKTITLFAALTILLGGLSAQQQIWEAQLSGSINWQRVTSLGYLVVGASDALYGIDNETGTVLWQDAELAGMAEESYAPIPGSPFVKFSVEGDTPTVIVLDPIEGHQLFNSTKDGLVSLKNEHVLLRNSAMIVVGNKTGNMAASMVCVDLGTGKVSWTKDDEFGMLTALHEMKGSDFIATTLFYIYRINAQTGEIVWKASLSEDNPMANMGQLGGLLQSMTESFLEPGAVEVRLITSEDKTAIYGGLQVRKETQSQSDPDKTMISYSNTYTKFDLATGEMVWEKATEMKGKLGIVAFNENGMYIFPDDGSKSRINVLDSRTGAGLWGKKGKGVNVKGSVLDFRFTEKGLFLATGKTDNAFLNLIDLNTGESKFKKYEKMKGQLEYVEMLPAGLFYVSEYEANILDMATGANKWSKSVRKDPGMMLNDGNTCYLFSSKDKSVYAVDKSTGKQQTYSTQELAFDGKETATGMEMYQGQLLLSSDQNLLALNNGTIGFQVYHSAPRESGLKRALLYANAVRAAYIGGVSKMAAGAYGAAATQQDQVVNEAILGGISETYDQMGDAGISYAQQAFAAANKRFKATAETQDFLFMLTQLPTKDHALVQVNKADGKTDGQVSLGKDKTPSYEVDAVLNKVYYRTSSNQIAAYQF